MRTASRLVAAGGALVLLGLLPWLSGRSAEYTVLRARYAEREATPEALAAVRAELGLEGGPLGYLGAWLAGLARGDLGTSWVSGAPVAPGVLAGTAVSLTLMAAALVVALPLVVLQVLPALRAGLRGRASYGAGVTGAALTALPEFTLATVLLLVGGVWLGWLPPYGWSGLEHLVLPALALGVPAGGLLGRLVATAVTAVVTEPWVRTWLVAGHGHVATGLGVLRRALPSVAGQVGLVLVGLTGGAVAVEEVFAVPGLGRLTLGAASSQDLPALQGGLLVVLVLAGVVGASAQLLRRVLLGRGAALPLVVPVSVVRRRDRVVPLLAAGLLGTAVVAGLLRDPFASEHPRLAPPTWTLPLGADASGRDLLARVGHGALGTVGTAVAVLAVCVVVGLVVGCLPRLAAGPVEVTNALPPVVAGLLVAAVQGPSLAGAAVAVALVSWAPLASHTAALVEDARRAPHVAVLPLLGTGPVRALLRHVLPMVAPPVLRHAALRLPGVALALAALGFLGLGPQPPTPEWGLLLAEGAAYVERAPWTVLGPAGALVLVSVLAVGAPALARGPRAAQASWPTETIDARRRASSGEARRSSRRSSTSAAAAP